MYEVTRLLSVAHSSLEVSCFADPSVLIRVNLKLHRLQIPIERPVVIPHKKPVGMRSFLQPGAHYQSFNVGFRVKGVLLKTSVL